ncbi:MAG TPA: metal-dependent hydrolase [Gaiellaceae bacterium]|nr:metal-dependent hydrolase [Gaiellaceae bacterium]
MSWAAHDLEPYVIQKHLGKRVAFMPLLLGSYAPDMFTKWFVYGVGFFGHEIKASNPAQFHRGWPGFGFTHSLLFGVLISLAIYGIWRKPVIAFSFLLGQWAHALTDTGDTVGTMLLFPFTTHLFSIGAWAYAGELGRQVDAGAYFSGLGFVWDGIWLVWATLSWKVLTRGYFRETVLAVDPFYKWAQHTLSETFLLAIYRAAYFYGVTRWIAWTIWAHVVHSFKIDISWGGPHWVKAIQASQVNAASCNCPCCKAARRTLMAHGVIVLAVRAKKLRQRLAPTAGMLLSRTE